MASIEQLLGHSTDQIEAMSQEELLEKFRSVFDLEAKLIAEGELKVIKDEPEDEEAEDTEDETRIRTAAKGPKRKSAAEKARERMDEMKKALLELETITTEEKLK
jgi:hypothetical protein